MADPKLEALGWAISYALRWAELSDEARETLTEALG